MDNFTPQILYTITRIGTCLENLSGALFVTITYWDVSLTTNTLIMSWLVCQQAAEVPGCLKPNQCKPYVKAQQNTVWNICSSKRYGHKYSKTVNISRGEVLVLHKEHSKFICELCHGSAMCSVAVALCLLQVLKWWPTIVTLLCKHLLPYDVQQTKD